MRLRALPGLTRAALVTAVAWTLTCGALAVRPTTERAPADKHRLRVDVIKMKAWNSGLDVDALRVIGYQGSCPCGWRGTRRDTYREARQESNEHVRPDA